VQLPALLDELGRRHFTNLLVEGGGEVLGAFHDAGLADEARVFVSPLLIGGKDAPAALDGRGPADAPLRLSSAAHRVHRVGEDLLYEIRLAQQ
jgi:diaminohydroxyphosphoribosylaminopyrimidine deaminase/5-amino-6-(5-phosphoribosylamino)uracil reductase